MTDELDEQELAKLCSEGNRLAEDELYTRYAGMVFALCKRYCRNTEDAKDLMQDAMIRVLDTISTYRFSGQGSLSGWIRRITINMALNRIQRRRLSFISLDNRFQYPLTEPTEQDVQRIPQDAILTMISQLPDARRAVFNLYCIDGYSHKEIGEKLRISEKGSAGILAKAKKQLQKMIIDYLNKTEV